MKRLAIDVAGSIRSGRVTEVPTRLVSQHGAPRFLRSDNGPEFVSHAILAWLADSRIETAHIDPGKPWQNADNESFNGKCRDECLSLESFRSREEARVVIEVWRKHYNHVRPYSSLKDLTPIEFKTRYASTNPGAILKVQMVLGSLGRPLRHGLLPSTDQQLIDNHEQCAE